ncbi:MAG: AMP-binding protein [Planctomycetales bacterium]|nr:AMP-binding protein [Planctomycetales bacterium]
MSSVPSKAAQGLNTAAPQVDRGRQAYPAGIPQTLDYPRFPAWGLLSRASSSVPQRIAVDFFGHTLSYAEVNLAAIRFANWLQRHGIGAGDRVGILLPNSPEYMIALNGIWRAGGVAVAISPLSVAEDVRVLVEHTRCRFIVCFDMFLHLLPQSESIEYVISSSLESYLPFWKAFAYRWLRWRCNRHSTSAEAIIPMWQAIESGTTELTPVERLPQRDPAYILSTGGTTGSPKAVTLSHGNIVANATQQAIWAGGSMGQESMLAVLPFFHCYGMSTMLAGGAALGATLYIQPRFRVRNALRAIERKRPTVFHAVPAMLAAMNKYLRRRPVDLRSLKWVISGGAALAPDVAKEFAHHSGAMVVEGYGLSEASPVTHVGPLDGSNRTGTIGLPLPDTECRIIDPETHQTVGDGNVGELVVRGPQVMLGYWQNQVATEQTLRAGWLHTGDLAVRDADGFYRIVDRMKDLIITSGFNVYPSDVEEVIRSFAGVADVAVVGVPCEMRGEIVKAFVVLQPRAVWDVNRLRAEAREKLAAHRRPLVWEQIHGDLPRNFLGKVQRRQLRLANRPTTSDSQSQDSQSQVKEN